VLSGWRRKTRSLKTLFLIEGWRKWPKEVIK